METKKNFFKELNDLNANLTVNVIANKYDYEKLGIPNSDTQRQSFRRKMRKIVLKVYTNIDSIEKSELKKFADFQTSALICAKNKKFENLKVSQIYPGFEKKSEKEQKELEDAHKKLIEKIK